MNTLPKRMGPNTLISHFRSENKLATSGWWAPLTLAHAAIFHPLSGSLIFPVSIHLPLDVLLLSRPDRKCHGKRFQPWNFSRARLQMHGPFHLGCHCHFVMSYTGRVGCAPNLRRLRAAWSMARSHGALPGKMSNHWSLVRPSDRSLHLIDQTYQMLCFFPSFSTANQRRTGVCGGSRGGGSARGRIPAPPGPVIAPRVWGGGSFDTAPVLFPEIVTWYVAISFFFREIFPSSATGSNVSLSQSRKLQRGRIRCAETEHAARPPSELLSGAAAVLVEHAQQRRQVQNLKVAHVLSCWMSVELNYGHRPEWSALRNLHWHK